MWKGQKSKTKKEYLLWKAINLHILTYKYISSNSQVAYSWISQLIFTTSQRDLKELDTDPESWDAESNTIS